jgi:CHRD domain
MRVRWLALATAVCAIVALALPAAAFAPTKPLFAALNGQNEVNAQGERGVGDRNGGGSFTAIIKGRQLCYGLAVKDIDDPMAAHIHRGGRNTAGPIVIPLESLPTNGDVASSAGCTQVSRRLVRQIRRNPNRFYVNVHTADFPDGAVRGQLFARGA